ncbi:twitching motility two-component system response regulator PilG [Thiothrix eikelboomii]|uniref:Twitching motility two-component system response regulator PilG n=1 Tax=Thiothrix eikelboomii TaxID=92487 RepID=A0A1T4WFJ8_9GAMM|nr:twitching motility two-component system response regulator PilG [Thiothrix eikelboomii]
MNTSDPNQVTPGRDLSGLKVLIIDDSKTILRTAEALLSEYQCWVTTASDGFEALPIIATFKPDVVFVDIMMPRLDGYQTCALIKANRNYRDIPVIMLSSKDGLFDLARGRLAGSDKYLTKPFTRQDLLSTIYSHVLPHLQATHERVGDGAAVARE